VDSPAVRDFVETAKAVASLNPIPDAWVPSRFRDLRDVRAKTNTPQPVSTLRTAR
jgi:hypothetical protein